LKLEFPEEVILCKMPPGQKEEREKNVGFSFPLTVKPLASHWLILYGCHMARDPVPIHAD
jgi:hypothetical protein